jgi:hypothetical protein
MLIRIVLNIFKVVGNMGIERIVIEQAINKLKSENIPLTYKGYVFDCGIEKSQEYDEENKTWGPEQSNCYCRYGNDNNYRFWFVGKSFGQTLQSFIQRVKSKNLTIGKVEVNQ